MPRRPERRPRRSLRKGTFVEPSRRTITSFLTDEWLPAVAAQGRRPGTVANYRIHVTAHIIPALGGIELQQLSPTHLNSFYRALHSEGRRNGRPMAQKTVRNVHSILHRALQDALRWGLVARNVASAANPPAGKSPERAVWTPPSCSPAACPVSCSPVSVGLRQSRWHVVSMGFGLIGVQTPPRPLAPSPSQQQAVSWSAGRMSAS
jgi:hypothetical protein